MDRRLYVREESYFWGRDGARVLTSKPAFPLITTAIAEGTLTRSPSVAVSHPRLSAAAGRRPSPNFDLYPREDTTRDAVFEQEGKPTSSLVLSDAPSGRHSASVRTSFLWPRETRGFALLARIEGFASEEIVDGCDSGLRAPKT